MYSSCRVRQVCISDEFNFTRFVGIGTEAGHSWLAF